MYTLGDTIILAPSMLSSFTGTNAWIVTLIGICIGILLILLYSKLSNAYPKKTYVEMLKSILGKWMGNILSILFLFTIFIMTMANLRGVGDFFTTQVLPETPIPAILILTTLTALYLLRNGIENIARTCEIFFPWTAFLLIMLLLLVIPEVRIENLNPTFVKGLGPIIGTTYAYMGYSFNELIVFLMIIPFVNQHSAVKKNFLLGLVIGGITLSIITAFCLTVLGDDFTGRNLYPTYILGKKISIGEFLERIEVFVGISWVFTIFFKITINLFALAIGTTQVLGISDYKTVLFPLGYFSVVCSIIFFPNIVYYNHFGVSVWSHHSAIVFIFMPIMLLSILTVKDKIKKHH